MASKMIVTLIDDVDGGRADQTVSFSYGGKAYEIDLSDANAERFNDVMTQWVQAARRVGGPARQSRPVTPRSSAELNTIRAWAREHGYTVADRGRIAATIIEAFDSAHR